MLRLTGLAIALVHENRLWRPGERDRLEADAGDHYAGGRIQQLGGNGLRLGDVAPHGPPGCGDPELIRNDGRFPYLPTTSRDKEVHALVGDATTFGVAYLDGNGR